MDQKTVEVRRKRKGMEKMLCKGVREKKTKEKLEGLMKAMKQYVEKKEGTEVGEKLKEIYHFK